MKATISILATVCLTLCVVIATLWLHKEPEPQPPPWLKPVGERGIQRTFTFTRTKDLQRVMQMAKEDQEKFDRTTILFPRRVFEITERWEFGGYTNLKVYLSGSTLNLSSNGCLFFGSNSKNVLIDGASIVSKRVLEQPMISVKGEYGQ